MGVTFCTRCVLDTSIPGIQITASGLCSACIAYDESLKNPVNDPVRRLELKTGLIERVKRSGARGRYDCIIGLSGGVDSSYALVCAKREGLRPLAVHLDNGWNSELAVMNIEVLVKGLGVDLITHVIDWGEFRALQLAFIRASVVDIELLTDHAIIALLMHSARRFGVRNVLTGDNHATESALPQGWNHRKTDFANIKSIARRFGGPAIRTFPHISTIEFVLSQRVLGYQYVPFLSYYPYVKSEAISELARDFGWRPYGGKHYESVFTRFYQGYILPLKFGIDKRRVHFSRLVCSGQLSRPEALVELSRPIYDAELLQEDRRFVLKKLGLSDAEFDGIMRAPARSHAEFGSDKKVVDALFALRRRLRALLGGKS